MAVAKKKKIRAVAATYFDQEIILISEVRQTKINIIWYQLYVKSKKKWHTWTYLQNRKRFIYVDNKFTFTKGERGKKDKLGVWN